MNDTTPQARSTKTYWGLILLLALLGGLNLFLPQGQFLPAQELPASKPMMALVTAGIMLLLYGGLGFLGLKLAARLGFADIWEPSVSNRQRFGLPALVGLAIGLFFILADSLFAAWHGLGPLPHPPFPTSLVASAVAGIGEEVIFRLFFISFWLWLVSAYFLKGRWQRPIFWIVATFSALAFALGHLPAVMAMFGFDSFGALPLPLLLELLLLNGLVSMAAAYYFKQYGFLAAVGVHFWTDVVWHVLWGLFS
jgi:hypothetical protein